MKFNLLITFIGLVTGQDLSADWDKIVNDLTHIPSNTWEAAKSTAASIPVRRHQNSLWTKIDPDTGKTFKWTKNSDIDREYDRAVYRVYNLRETMGYAMPYEIFR